MILKKISTYLSFNLNLLFSSRTPYNDEILFYKNQSTEHKNQTEMYCKILCFSLSGVLLFDESEPSFIRFSTVSSILKWKPSVGQSIATTLLVVVAEATLYLFVNGMHPHHQCRRPEPGKSQQNPFDEQQHCF